jgi:hypothetical protein
MVVMDLFTRRIVGLGVAPTHARRRGGLSPVQSRPIAPAAPEACEYAQRPAVSIPSLAGELASPRDQGNQDRTFVPCSHAFVERLIGTLRREYLDPVLFCIRLDLQRKLGRFVAYYNQARVQERARANNSVRTSRPCSAANRRSAAILLAGTLSRPVPHTDRRLISHSPCTGERNARNALVCPDRRVSIVVCTDRWWSLWGHLRNLVYDPGGIGAPHQDRSFSVVRRQTATPMRRMSRGAAAVWLIAPLATQAQIRISRVRVNRNLTARLGAGAENTK